MEDLFQVGAVTGTHGLRGEVKVYPTTDEPKRYEVLKDVILDTGKERLSLKIAHVRFFKQIVIVKFAGLNDINEVEGFKGAKLYVSRENALELREDEYYFADLAGLRVQTEEGEQLGIVKDILQTGANDVYVVGREHKKDLLLPAIKDCVKEIDVEGGRMVVHLLPGLLEASEGGAK
ncbi:MAG: ribosome maturation factor RimM [Eubacterium sp.]|nr:ribosome maturation factor RimM [Eubacterium sp.]